MTAPLSSLLWWDALATERTVFLKDGALMACLRVRGPDLHSAMDSALVAQADQLNNCFKRLNEGWGLSCEARRREVCTYAVQEWHHPVARLVDEERQEQFEAPASHYETETTLTLTWEPPLVQSLNWGWWFFAHLPQRELLEQTPAFEEQVRRVLAMLGDVSEEATWLTEEALLMYLHSTVSFKEQQVGVPDPACYLDTYLTDSDLERRWELPSLTRKPVLGGQYLCCVSVKAYPRVTHPGMLDVLATLPLAFRACTRYLPLSRAKAVSEAQKYGDSHYGKRYRHGGSTGRVQRAAVDASDEASEFQRGVERDYWGAGPQTQTVVVWGPTYAEARTKAERVEAALNDARFLAKIESGNALAAWRGTIPGNRKSNKRLPILTTRNLAHLVLLNHPTVGPAWNPHLQGYPLLRVTGRGQTPIWLDLYDDDVGHSMVIGPTGTGKSLLLALMAMQWLKYGPDAQVYIFDKDQSARAATYAVGGDWFELGAELDQAQQGGMALDDADSPLWGSLWTPPPGWWQCYETARLHPAIVPKVLAPTLRALEDRLTGAPTLIILDEAWKYLTYEMFTDKIQDWLLTLRKKNAVVLFSTQNLEHITKNAIGGDIFQSCVTRIFLSNHRALDPGDGIGKLYADIGLSLRQRQIIATLARKKQYYYDGPHGSYTFELGVAAKSVQLAFAGSGRKADLAAMEKLYCGDGQFAVDWLRHKGLHAQAERLQGYYDELAT
jgi:type IV secretory pathway VirB4 component